MKRITLFFCIVILASVVVAQQVPRNLVVLEIGTGTWCQFCPAAANGADQLLANGHPVAVIKYHSGDNYANVYSNARVNYYGISGFPTAYFDGLNPIVGGGSASQTMYPQYLARVNQRMAVQSAFTISVTGSHTCLTNFTANVTVNKVATNSSTNLRLHAVLTEKHIPQAWQGMTEVNHACRLMIPDQFGTQVTFSGSNTQQFTLQFSLNPQWVFENMELVVFLQDQPTKEIYQGTKIALSDFSPQYQYDAGIIAIDSLPQATCNGIFTPKVTIRNYGSSVLTSTNIKYKVNNGPVSTYAWNGSLNYLEQAIAILPPITFTAGTSNQIIVYTENPNGNNDQCVSNDAFSATIPYAMTTPSLIKLYLRTDANPGETTWEIVNSSGTVIYSGGPYTNSGQIIQLNLQFYVSDCYRFTIYDSGGNGISSPGNVILYYGSNNVIFQGRNFGWGASTEFFIGDPTGVASSMTDSEIKAYLSDNKKEVIIEVSGSIQEELEAALYTIAGQRCRSSVFSYHGMTSTHKLGIGGLKPGLYLLKVSGKRTNKVIKIWIN